MANNQKIILVLNCGSQSIKWKLFSLDFKAQEEGNIRILNQKNYKNILQAELKKINERNIEITTIGHRVVHAGGKFNSPLIIDKKNLKELEKISELAPLHSPYNILGIKISQKTFPTAKQIAIFDTDFYSELPKKASTYALPEDIRKKYEIRRYGFHGISHDYASSEAAKIISKPREELKIISCHLGGGASITAIDRGKAVDTSMGFTPLEGLVMMTRAGNVDPGIILFLNQKSKRNKFLASESKNQNLDYILNNESGMKGLCGISDMKEILTAIESGNKKAQLALEIYIYNIQKYIGAYFAILGGCDLLVFTGAIGYGSAKIVDLICKDFNILKDTRVLKIKPDEERGILNKIVAKF